MIRLQRILLIVIYLGLVLAFTDSVLADDDSANEGTGKTEYTRNRIDFTALFLDTARFDTTTGVFGYTRNLSSNMSLSVRAMYLDSDADSSGGRGFDTTIVTPYTGMVYRWREKFLILPPLRTRILLVPL